jgi:RNA polymerase sigma-70 factor, ECF subfamily
MPHADTSSPPETDASQRLLAWLQASASGDASAFRRLHRATHQRLLLVALEVLPQRERAEEALQEAYLKVWRHAAQFDERLSRPMTWMMRIVRHTAIDHWRARHGELALMVPLSDEVAHTVADPAATPEQQCVDGRLLRQVHAALAQLPHAERHAAGLVLVHGCTPAEAARASGLPGDQGRLPLRRALTQLRRQFQPGAQALAA